MESKKTWPLDMYSKMGENQVNELPPVKGSFYLIIQGSQLLVIEKNEAVESICLLGGGGSVRVHYSNQFMGITVVDKQKAQTNSKFKMRFAQRCGKSAEDSCLEAVYILAKFVSVTEHPSHRGRKPTERVRKTMTQIMKEVLEGNPELLKTSELILPEKDIEELVQECLLDPGFPALVARVEELLEKRSADSV